MMKLSFISIMILLTIGCEKAAENRGDEKKVVAVKQKEQAIKAPEVKEKEILPASAFMSAEWADLIPTDDLDALLNPPSYIDEIVDGSAEDQLSNTLKNDIENTNGDRYQQALTSTRVKSMINNVAIKIPAFIVPLEFDDQLRVTQFFMVPFFGACLHQPPPPPNQTIFVDYPQGFVLESLYDPYWISGVITTSLVENDMATAAYTLDMHAFELYEYDE